MLDTQKEKNVNCVYYSTGLCVKVLNIISLLKILYIKDFLLYDA